MAKSQRVNGLELPEDLEFQHRCWKLQRAGWIIMGLIALAGLLGLFGRGWLSGTAVEAGDGKLAVEYERVARAQAPLRLAVHLRSTESEATHLWISREYIDRFEVRQVTPEPAEVKPGADRLNYIFLGADRPVTVIFDLEPREAGMRVAQVGVGERSVAFTQWVLP